MIDVSKGQLRISFKSFVSLIQEIRNLSGLHDELPYDLQVHLFVVLHTDNISPNWQLNLGPIMNAKVKATMDKIMNILDDQTTFNDADVYIGTENGDLS